MADVTYNKQNESENIQIGDLISFAEEGVTRAVAPTYIAVLGICTAITGNLITVSNEGTHTVNVTGIVCLNDELTISDIPGKCKAIKYSILDKRQFNVISVGKITGIHSVYNTVQAVLNVD